MKKYEEKYLKQAHKDSIYNEIRILSSKTCGCFHCKRTFAKEEIEVWTDEGSRNGKTAMCPYCGVDSVLGDEYPIVNKVFMNQMKKYWF